jgi:hypothetical protein
VVGFDPVVGVGLGVVPGARSDLIEDGRVDRCLVGDDFGWGRSVLECADDESAGGRLVPIRETNTSMTWPYWSIARYR